VSAGLHIHCSILHTAAKAVWNQWNLACHATVGTADQHLHRRLLLLESQTITIAATTEADNVTEGEGRCDCIVGKKCLTCISQLKFFGL
jgi:hypothetical protein